MSFYRSLHKWNVFRMDYYETKLAAPAILVLLVDLIQIIPEDFKFKGFSLGIVALFFVNSGTDLFRKWFSENKY